MKRRNKIALIGLGLMATVFVASSCTANFCTDKEKARMFYVFEPGVSAFYAEEIEGATLIEGTKIYQIVNYDSETHKSTHNSYLNSILNNAYEQGIYLPTKDFLTRWDQETVKSAMTKAGFDLLNDSYDQNDICEALENYGYLRFYNDDSRWGNFNNVVVNLTKPTSEGGLDYQCIGHDFIEFYKSSLDNTVANYRSCITTLKNGGDYGDYNGHTIHMDATTWGDAWGKGGHLIEGLIVYPVAWLLDSFANIFSGNNLANFNDGVPQILSLLVVTVIVRLFIFLVTIKSTLSQQKMTALQPELAKIQQKYPNANTNSAQKQRMAEEQMRLYKKHGVNPLSSLLVLVVQFPVFIGVWGAMQGSAALSSGSFHGLELSASIFDRLKMGPKANGWWVALILIILMSAAQFFSMKVPQWLQKARTRKVARLTKNPAEKSQNRTANIVSYVMLIMIIIMGFTLPAAMGVYWLIGALVSLVQSTIMHFVNNKAKKQAR